MPLITEDKNVSFKGLKFHALLKKGQGGILSYADTE